MEVPFAQSLEVARRTRSAGGIVIWNLAPVPLEMTGRMIQDLLNVTNCLITNEHEALDAANALGESAVDLEGAACSLARAGQLTCIVTLGAEGTLAVLPNGTRVREPALAIQPVDTTGAGDTFVGAVACMLNENSTPQEALEVGCEAAGLACLMNGAQDGMPMRSVIKSLAKRRISG
jgi:ribokinase